MKTITLNEVLSAARHCLTGAIMVPGRGEHYERGFQQGVEAERVSIAVNNVWSASIAARPGCSTSVQSYERIGYHAGSASFLAGVLNSGCPVTVYRSEDGCINKYRLEH